MNVGSLFSGIGGLDHGLHRAGWNHAFFCESDGYRRDVLRARWPGVPVYDDVREVAEGPRPERLRAVGGINNIADSGRSGSHAENGHARPDLLCGGFPCQDLSVAGKRKGFAGERSSLFFEFARIADTLRPRWLLIENVPGLFSSNGGRDFGELLGTLADVGYGVAWRTLDSRFFGVPQRRRRVFIVGAVADGDPAGAAQRAGEVLAVGQGCDRHSAKGGEAWQDIARPLGSSTRPGRSGGGMRYDLDNDTYVEFAAWNLRGREEGARVEPDTLASIRSSSGGSSRSYVGVRRLTPVECERLQALPDGWTELGGTPDSRRYAALGDAVTASVGEWIGRRLLEAVA